MKATMPMLKKGDLIRFDKRCYTEKIRSTQNYCIPENTFCFYDGTHNGFMRVIVPEYGKVVCAIPFDRFRYYVSMITYISPVKINQ